MLNFHIFVFYYQRLCFSNYVIVSEWWYLLCMYRNYAATVLILHVVILYMFIFTLHH